MAIRVWPICLAVGLCCGCQSAARHQHAKASLREDVAPAREFARHAESESSDDVQPASHVETDIAPPAQPTELSLQGSIAIGLSQNPDLIALRQAENVSSAALGVA